MKHKGKGILSVGQALILLQRILSQFSIIFGNRKEENNLKQQLTQQAGILFLIEIPQEMQTYNLLDFSLHPRSTLGPGCWLVPEIWSGL